MWFWQDRKLSYLSFLYQVNAEGIMKSKSKPETIDIDPKQETCRKYSSEEKICIVVEGLRREDSINYVCRPAAIHSNVYCRWSMDFRKAGKKRLQSDAIREVNSSVVNSLHGEI